MSWETPIQCAITPPRALLYQHPVVLAIASVTALASCASTPLGYEITFQTLNSKFSNMLDTELHCVQMFIQYIHLVTTLMLPKIPPAAVYCRVVRCVPRIVE